MGRSAELPRGLVDSFRVTSEEHPDDASCAILHVDMDAFYASVEIVLRPELRDRPVVVGGIGPRGVVCSANYLARQFGVRSAMPIGRARKLCPRAVFLPPDFGRYRQVSAGVMAIFRDVTPVVEPISLDEAFLDVAGALRRLRTTPVGVADLIRERVLAEYGITCSVGLSGTKFIAKLASGMAKPDGVIVVPPARVFEFLHPLPVSALWGVGARTAQALDRVGMRTIADVAAASTQTLRHVVGNAAAEHLSALAHGRDERAVTPDTVEKSVGAEETFDVDQHDPAVLARELLRLSEKTTANLRTKGLRGRTVCIKVRFADFTTITRSVTLVAATNVGMEVYRAAHRLLVEQVPAGQIRLIGVRVEQLTSGSGAGEQLLLGAREHGWSEADHAADEARSKFGSAAIRPAALLPKAPKNT